MSAKFTDRFIQTSSVDRLREQLAAKRADIERQKAALAEDLRALEAQESILAQLVATKPANGKPPRGGVAARQQTRKTTSPQRPADAVPKTNGRGTFRPKAAILDLLRDAGPLSLREIVDRLAAGVGSGAKPPRKILTDTLWRMKKQGELVERGDRLELKTANHRPKGDVAQVVAEGIRQHPGLTSPQLADLLQGPLANLHVRQPRKAVFRTLFTLKNRQRAIRTDDSGKYFVLD